MCLLMCVVHRTSTASCHTNLLLVCGDYLLEILSEAIRQTSQLASPGNCMETGTQLDQRFNRRIT